MPSCDEDWAYQHQHTSGGAGALGGAKSTGGVGGNTASNGGNEPTSRGGQSAEAGSGGSPFGSGGDSGQAGSGTSGAGGSGSGEAGGGAGGEGGVPGVEPTFTSYGADDANFRYSGRIDFSNPKSPRFGEGAVHVLARFRGTALRVLVNDDFRYGTYRDYFEVVIDGSERHKISPVRGTTAYEITRSLSDAEHTVVVSKRTEASIGTARFLGLDVAGELLEPPPVEPHRIEIIGDSISAGSGNEANNGSTKCSEDGWGQPYENADLAYGPVLARKLNADYHVTAVSGIGLVRNYSSMYDARPMPQVYDLLFVDSTASPVWDTTLFVPDAILITLGTNDFSPGDNPPGDPRPAMDKTVYYNAYVAFVDTLHGYYPNAHVFGVSSPMLGDGWPSSTDTFATDLKSVLTDVEAHYATDEVPLFHKVFVSKVAGTGCGTHPGVAEHAQIASQIEPTIRSVMGW